MGRYITVGTGISAKEKGDLAAKEAITKALAKISKKPSIAFVFFTDNYDPNDINEQCKKLLKGTEFVGGSVDGVVEDDKFYEKGVGVTIIESDHLHFGVSSTSNIKNNFFDAAKNTTIDAVNKVPIDKYVDPYVQFSRLKKGKLSDFIRIPSFFVMTLPTGIKLDRFGNEDQLVQGISSVVGNFIPIFGGSLGYNMDKNFRGEKAEVYGLHSGKIVKDGIIVVFVSTGLLYSNALEHGAVQTGKTGYISKVNKGGFIVEEVSGKNVIEWYAENIGVSVDEFKKKVLYYTQFYPLGFPDGFGNIIMRAVAVMEGDSLLYIAPFKENTPVFLMQVATDQGGAKVPKILYEQVADHIQKNDKPAFTFATPCASRKRIFGLDVVEKEMKLLKTKFGSKVFGFSSFGEIGAKPAQTCRFNHLSINVLNLYDKLIS